MKIEDTKEKPAFDLMNPTLNEGMAHAKDIKMVLLNDGNWYWVEPGTFKFMKSTDSVPFVRFQGDKMGTTKDNMVTIECFPATVAGWAY